MMRIPINEQGWGLFVQLLKEFVAAPLVGRQGILLFALLIALLFGFNGLNIVNSYVGRDFMTAIADRDSPRFLREALVYVAVLTALTIVAVILRYSEERLGLIWRDFMTRRFVELYLRYPTYYRMNDVIIRGSGIEHTDQRIADDVRAFTTTTLSFTIMVLNGVFTVLAFSGVLWSISPILFGVTVAYAAIGSYFTVLLGGPLVDLNYSQLDKEAVFRSSLINVRERAESLAMLHREERLSARLLRQFDAVVDNFKQIILVNRGLGYFTTGYNYMVLVIPIVIAAPLYISGAAEFGVITQSAMAFATLIGAFSLIVTQFQSISSFAAVIERLINLWYAIELAQTETVSGLDLGVDDERLAYENLTLRSPVDGSILLHELTISVPRGTRVLVTGAAEATKDALFKATAGIGDGGTGRVIRPRLDRILFLPERPYLPPGTLRDALVADDGTRPVPDSEITETLRSLGIASILDRAGGLDVRQDWGSVLSVHEQQLVSFARILLASPHFAVLERPSTDLAPEKTDELLNMLHQRNITYLVMARSGQRPGGEHAARYDAVLELKPEGRWEWRKNGTDG